MKRILIVDDEEDVRLFLEDFLSERDFEVECVGTGQEALDAMDKKPADVVLLDIMMPGMDGIQCLEALRKKHTNANVIMLSAIKEEARIEKARKLGACDYIIKPFSLSYLENELVKMLKKSA